ncbi:autotransporter outer membrane beta-barrel domain-containing protein, partial [Salinisphaera sp. USBA-960]|nr:autotransporter outer membrane beta-barrel domain-containing protein [Salifodinibacter halophilus]
APRPDGGAWVQGAAGYAKSSFDVTRPVHVGVFDRTARADADADGWYAMAEAGWRFETPSASIEPLVGVYHSRLSLDDVTETGAGEANLRVEGKGYDTTTLGAGVRFIGKAGRLRPTFDIRYLHDLNDDAP